MSSFHIREWYRDDASEYFADFGDGDRFWLPKYYAFEIDNRAKLEETLAYMHMNPVRAGLVLNASEWQWSSARWYERRQPVCVPISWAE